MNLPERFIVFDFETTGLSSEKHEIIEIGAIRVNRDSDRHDTFQGLVVPTQPISAMITGITGIDRKMVEADGEPLSSVFPQFLEFVGNLPMVAFNAPFDTSFLRAAERSLGLPPMKNRITCALKAARSAWPGRRSYKLADLARDADLNVGTMHRALADCHATMLLYVAAIGTLSGAR